MGGLPWFCRRHLGDKIRKLAMTRPHGVFVYRGEHSFVWNCELANFVAQMPATKPGQSTAYDLDYHETTTV
jgi:hypothetical protein